MIYLARFPRFYGGNAQEMHGSGDAFGERLGAQLDEQFLAGFRVDLPIARQIGDLRAAQRVVEDQNAGDCAHEGVLRVVEGAHVEGDAALQIADVLRGLQVLAVQKHAQLHRVAKAARFRVDALEDDCEVRPIVDAEVKLPIFQENTWIPRGRRTRDTRLRRWSRRFRCSSQ